MKTIKGKEEPQTDEKKGKTNNKRVCTPSYVQRPAGYESENETQA
jgi:hypothetical protein